MTQLLDCLVTYFTTTEDGLPRRYYCYHLVAGPGAPPDGGVASITLRSGPAPAHSGGGFQDFHAVRAGGPDMALVKALNSLDAYPQNDPLHRARSDVRRSAPGQDPTPLGIGDIR